jgi:AraC family transcriptional regulator
MTIPLAVNFGVSQRAPQQTLPGILGIEAGKSADVALAQSCPFRGGLPPSVLRRVREYIEAHLEKNVSLEVLAGVAGLSTSYFARAFKQSEGVAPHDYLMRRRVHRALELLAGTDLPLSAIAHASGFSDQSHFARRFRQHSGVTPSRYRWLTR